MNAYGQKVLHNYNPIKQGGKNPNTHGANYPSMRNFGAKDCHVLMAFTFHGARPEGYQCDHINGVAIDNRVCNLQEVTSAENMRRARYIRALRELMPHHYQTYTREDYLRFFAMPFDEFKAMLNQFTKG